MGIIIIIATLVSLAVAAKAEQNSKAMQVFEGTTPEVRYSILHKILENRGKVIATVCQGDSKCKEALNKLADKLSARLKGTSSTKSFGKKVYQQIANEVLNSQIGIAIDVIQAGLELFGWNITGAVVGATGNIAVGAVAGFTVAGLPGAAVGGAVGFCFWGAHQTEQQHPQLE